MFDDAAIYDLLHPPLARIAREGAHLCAWAAGGRRVLELACGTGAVAAHFAAAGHEVTATDLSPAMVTAAQANCDTTARVEAGDMMRPPAGPWDRVLILGNSLNLLPDEAAVVVTLQAIRAGLAPGGRLLVQILNPRASGRQAPQVSSRTTTSEGVALLAVKSLVPSGKGRLLTISWHAGSACGSSVTWLLDLDRTAIERCLHAASWTIWTCHGDLAGSGFDPLVSPDLVIDAAR